MLTVKILCDCEESHRVQLAILYALKIGKVDYNVNSVALYGLVCSSILGIVAAHIALLESEKIVESPYGAKFQLNPQMLLAVSY
jgi:hypothetical protein